MDEDREQTNANPSPEGSAEKPEDVAATHSTKDDKQDGASKDDAVDEASEDSFPTSDAPSW